jgi:hypothetical protein
MPLLSAFHAEPTTDVEWVAVTVVAAALAAGACSLDACVAGQTTAVNTRRPMTAADVTVYFEAIVRSPVPRAPFLSAQDGHRFARNLWIQPLK